MNSEAIAEKLLSGVVVVGLGLLMAVVAHDIILFFMVKFWHTKN